MKKHLSFLAVLLLVANFALAQKVAYIWNLTSENTGEMEKAQTFFDQYFVNDTYPTCPKSVGKFLDANEFVNNIDGKMNDVSVIWLNMDRPGNSYNDNVALISNSDFVNALKTFVKNGGSLLLTKEAVPMVNLIGRMCEPTEKGHGSFTNSGGALKQWVVNANIANTFDRRGHAVYAGISTAKTDGTGAEGFAFESSTSWYTDNNTGWNDLLPKGDGLNTTTTTDANNDPNKLRNFERSWNCIDLGTWGHIGDYFGAFVVEFLPGMFNEEEWKGTVLTCGPAAYQWVNENAFLDNIKLFTKNAINYLLTKPDVAASVTFNSASQIKATGRYVSTFYSDKATLIPTGVLAYTAKIEGSEMTLNKVSGNIIPANTGVMLVGAEASSFDLQLYPVGAETIAADNAFAGTTSETLGSVLKASYTGKTLYVVSKKDGVLGFYPLGNGTTVGANKAFLVAEGATSARSFEINIDVDDVVTAVRNVNTAAGSQASDAVYSLTGQQLSAPRRGINIVGGKKVIVK